MRTLTIALTIMAGVAGDAAAQSTENVVFDRHALSNGGGDTVALYWVDVDADGDGDLIALRRDGPGVLYRNEAGLLVADAPAADALLEAGPSRAAAFGDVDGDGDLDAFLVRGPDAGNLLLANLGGRFEAVATSPALAGEGLGTAAAFGDLDADGWLDLVVVNGQGTDLVAFGKGGFTFEVDPSSTLAQVAGPSTAVALADLDADGDLDVVVTHADGVDNDVFVNRGGDSTGLFDRLLHDPATTGGGNSQGVTVADLDLDGLPELLVANDGDVNFLYENVSSNGLLAFSRVSSGPFDPDAGDEGRSMASSVGDVEPDGDMDILVVNEGMDNFVYLATGETEFDYLVITEGLVSSDDGDSEDATLADPDDDGDLDVFIADASGGVDAYYENLGALWTELGAGSPGLAGEPWLTGHGVLLPGAPVELRLRNAAPHMPAALLIGTEASPVPFAGGVLVPRLTGAAVYTVSGLHTDAEGSLSVAALYPSGLPTGFRLYLQAVLVDGTVQGGLALSNGLRAMSL